jgi:hypothetical protein
VAKIKKRKLKWIASTSSQVVGYKLYWSENSAVNYYSKYVSLGNVTEIVLPEDVDSFVPGGGPVEFGITAVDELGNESDMITLKAPYQFNVPKAPEDLYFQRLDDFSITRVQTPGEEEDDRVDYYVTHPRADESEENEPIMLVDAIGSADHGKTGLPENDFELSEEIRKVAEKK